MWNTTLIYRIELLAYNLVGNNVPLVSLSQSNLFFEDNKLPKKDEMESVRAGQKLGAVKNVNKKLNVVERVTVYKVKIHNVMDYASLCLMSASTTTLKRRKSIQRIIGVNKQQARVDLVVSSLNH